MKLYTLLFLVLVGSFRLNAQTSASEIYTDAMNDYARKAFSSAYQKFHQYVQRSDVETAQLPAAYYFAAECSYEIGDYSGAIFDYERVTSYYRLSNFLEDALYKLGLSYNTLKDYSKSRERLWQLLKDIPNTPYQSKAQYWMAENYLAEKMYNEALVFYELSRAAKKDNPNLPMITYKMGGIYEQVGDFKRAIDMYDTLLTYFRNSSVSSSALYRVGYCYFKLKLYDNAIVELSNPELNGLSEDKRNEIDFILGVSYLSTGEFEKAEALFIKLQESKLSDERIRQVTYSLAWSKLQSKKYIDAQKIFNTVAQGSDTLAQLALYWKGETLRYQQKKTEALKTYEDFAKKFPASLLAKTAQYQMGVIYYEQKQFQKARSLLLSAASSGEGDLRSRIFTVLGELELNRDNTANAINYFNSALQLDSASSEFKNRAQFGMAAALYKKGQFKKVITTLLALEKSSVRFESDRVSFLLGESYFQEKDYAEALTRYKQISLGNEKLMPSAMYSMAYCYYNLKDYDNCVYIFNDFVKMYPSESRMLDAKLRLADSYFAVKKYKDAQSEYKDLLKPNSKNQDYVFYQYGLALFKSGQSKEAVAQLKKLVEKFPKSEYAESGIYLTGWISFQLGNIQNAIGHYQDLLQKYPNSSSAAQAVYSLGDCYYNLGAYDTAITYYARVVDDYPSSSNVYDAINGIQLSYNAKGDIETASTIIDKYSSNKKLSYSDMLYLKKGELYFNAGDYVNARISYESFLKLFPKSKLKPKAIYWCGKCAELLSEPDIAIDNYSKVFNSYPSSEEASSSIIEWGKLLISKGEIDSALSVYELAYNKLRESQLFPEILYNKGIAQLKKEDEGGAYDTFDELTMYYAASVFADKARLEIGVINMNAKKYQDALKNYQVLVANRTDEIGAGAQYNIGQLYQQQEKFNEAITNYVRVLNTYAAYDEWVTRAYLRLGECYEGIRDVVRAGEMYTKVLEKHSGDDFGSEATQKLMRLQ